jgi:hypothetical protein
MIQEKFVNCEKANDKVNAQLKNCKNSTVKFKLHIFIAYITWPALIICLIDERELKMSK